MRSPRSLDSRLRPTGVGGCEWFVPTGVTLYSASQFVRRLAHLDNGVERPPARPPAFAKVSRCENRTRRSRWTIDPNRDRRGCDANVQLRTTACPTTLLCYGTYFAVSTGTAVLSASCDWVFAVYRLVVARWFGLLSATRRCKKQMNEPQRAYIERQLDLMSLCISEYENRRRGLDALISDLDPPTPSDPKRRLRGGAGGVPCFTNPRPGERALAVKEEETAQLCRADEVLSREYIRARNRQSSRSLDQ